MQDPHFVHLLQFMCIEELGVDMLCEITLHITRMHLCNTIRFIFIDSHGGIQSTHLLNVLNHPIEVMHTRDASYIVVISKFFVEIDTRFN